MADFTDRDYFVKICGVTSLEGAEASIVAGATAIGLIFAQSPRAVTLDQASVIAEAVRGRIVRVGVFRDFDAPTMFRTVERLNLDVVQFHGPLEPRTLATMRGLGVGVVKALALGDEEFFTFEEEGVDAVLVDGPIPGSGASHAWDELHQRVFTRPVIAAGGLTPDTVARVLDEVDVWGVDVATGVESTVGIKDPALVNEFVATARRHFTQREEHNG